MIIQEATLCTRAHLRHDKKLLWWSHLHFFRLWQKLVQPFTSSFSISNNPVCNGEKCSLKL